MAEPKGIPRLALVLYIVPAQVLEQLATHPESVSRFKIEPSDKTYQLRILNESRQDLAPRL